MRWDSFSMALSVTTALIYDVQSGWCHKDELRSGAPQDSLWPPSGSLRMPGSVGSGGNPNRSFITKTTENKHPKLQDDLLWLIPARQKQTIAQDANCHASASVKVISRHLSYKHECYLWTMRVSEEKEKGKSAKRDWETFWSSQRAFLDYICVTNSDMLFNL